MTGIIRSSASVISALPNIGTAFNIKAVSPSSIGRIAQVCLKPVYQNPSASRLWTIGKRLTGMETGFHGTSLKNLHVQLSQGKFNDLGKKIYFADMETAAKYALMKSKYDGSEAVIVQIGSKQRGMMNRIDAEGWGFGLGFYSYFLTNKAEVTILKAYQAQETTQ